MGKHGAGPVHGTLSGWKYHKCRCAKCRRAHQAYGRAYRATYKPSGKISAPHGTPRAYGQGCRCSGCRLAMSTHREARRNVKAE